MRYKQRLMIIVATNNTLSPFFHFLDPFYNELVSFKDHGFVKERGYNWVVEWFPFGRLGVPLNDSFICLGKNRMQRVSGSIFCY